MDQEGYKPYLSFEDTAATKSPAPSPRLDVFEPKEYLESFISNNAGSFKMDTYEMRRISTVQFSHTCLKIENPLSNNEIRMRYMNKLTVNKVWLPEQEKPKTH